MRVLNFLIEEELVRLHGYLGFGKCEVSFADEK